VKRWLVTRYDGNAICVAIANLSASTSVWRSADQKVDSERLSERLQQYLEAVEESTQFDSESETGYSE